MNRFVSISTYATLVKINRTSVYKRIKKGTAILLEDCEVPVIDTWQSKGAMKRNHLTPVKDSGLPSWAMD